MTSIEDILRARTARQFIERPDGCAADPAAVTRRLCAVQAQDYAGALWAVGLRTEPSATIVDVEGAIAAGLIVRTWAMRGTLHFVAPADVRWLLGLTAPRALARATKRHSDLGLDASVFERAARLLSRELEGGRALTRPQVMALLEGDGIATSGQRGYHVLWTLSLWGLLCVGPTVGRQQSFVLLDDWVPGDDGTSLDRADALARLAGRYFNGHGPATTADFARWPDVTLTEARVAIAGVPGLETRTVDGADYHATAAVWDLAAPDAGDSPRDDSARVHLLPGFDEYVIGYADRVPPLGRFAERYSASIGTNGLLRPTLVTDDRVAGTWTSNTRKAGVDLELSPFRRLTRPQRAATVVAAERYAAFLRKRVNVRG